MYNLTHFPFVFLSRHSRNIILSPCHLDLDSYYSLFRCYLHLLTHQVQWGINPRCTLLKQCYKHLFKHVCDKKDAQKYMSENKYLENIFLVNIKTSLTFNYQLMWLVLLHLHLWFIAYFSTNLVFLTTRQIEEPNLTNFACRR